MIEAISATARDVTHRLRPISERILAALPGPRGVWIVLWAVLPWLNAGANLLLEDEARSAIWEQSRTLVVLNYAALSAAVVITLWGTGRIAHRLETLRAATSNVLDGDNRDPFREMNTVFVPLVAAGATATAFAVTTLLQDGWTAAILRGATWLILGIPIWSFLWTYASLQLGLDRLGREHLRPGAAHADPSLGLRPLGDVAFMGLWMLLAWLVPVLLTGLPEDVGVVIGLLVLAAGLAAFFFSLLRLHRQMAAVKASELAIARDLYAQAYEPLRAEQTLEALERQRSLLIAADALEKRAREIHQWPIDEGTWARVITDRNQRHHNYGGAPDPRPVGPVRPAAFGSSGPNDPSATLRGWGASLIITEKEATRHSHVEAATSRTYAFSSRTSVGAPPGAWTDVATARSRVGNQSLGAANRGPAPRARRACRSMEEAKSQSLREASKTGFFVRGLDNEVVSPLFDAACEATAEAIWNALCAAEDFTGRAGNWAPALPHDDLVALLARHGRIQTPS